MIEVSKISKADFYRSPRLGSSLKKIYYKEVESLHCFFVFRWIKLEFGVRGNFRLLSSNLNSKMQDQFEVLRKCHFSSLMIFSQTLPHELVTMKNNE